MNQPFRPEMKFVVNRMVKPKHKLKLKLFDCLRKLGSKAYITLKDNVEYTLNEAGKVTGVFAFCQMANRTLHPLERLLWLCLILAALSACCLMSFTQLKRFSISPTVISLDRDYLDWSGPLPAVTLCYHDHLDVGKANDFIFDKWNVSSDDDEHFYFMEFLISIINASATSYADIVKFAEDERFDDLDLYDVIRDVNKLFKQEITTFNPNFEIHKSTVMTERGMCYVFNSPISRFLSVEEDSEEVLKKDNKPLTCKYGKQQCFIKINLFKNTGTIDVHSPYEVSDNSIIDLKKAEEVTGTFKVLATVADQNMKSLSPSQRKCVFETDESSELPVYSKTLCLAHCRAIMALEMCNCVPFFYPYVEGPSCNPAGFECLLDFKWPNWASHICKCQNTCEELQYTAHSIKRSSWASQLHEEGEEMPESASLSYFRLEVVPPKVRMKRDVLFSFEDLLVSFGGTMSLFLGISILSIVQLIFFVFETALLNIFKCSLWCFRELAVFVKSIKRETPKKENSEK